MASTAAAAAVAAQTVVIKFLHAEVAVTCVRNPPPLLLLEKKLPSIFGNIHTGNSDPAAAAALAEDVDEALEKSRVVIPGIFWLQRGGKQGSSRRKSHIVHGPPLCPPFS